MIHHNTLPLQKIRVWDLPLRLFHWSLVGLVVMSWVTSQADLDLYYDMTLHMYCGYSLLTLLIFRVLWGFWGSDYACFCHFVCSFKTTLNYAKNLFKPSSSHFIGHNPLGAWSVLLLLTALFVQTSTGLFASDEISTEGPLYERVSSEMSQWLTWLHKINFYFVLLGLIGLHLSAVFFYLFYKKENLIRPMITGNKWLPSDTEKASFKGLGRAFVFLALAYGSVYLLVFVKW